MVVTSLILLLIIVGTILDVRQRIRANKIEDLSKTEVIESPKDLVVEDGSNKNPKISALSTFLISFSAYSNILMIFKNDERRKFTCLNALRFWAFLW